MRNGAPRLVACLCFILSGSAAVSYQLLWLRAAMGSFGVITPVISCVLSAFMLGLGIGTLLAGRHASGLSARHALRWYAAMEMVTAFGACCVPWLFSGSYHLLLQAGGQDSAAYLLLSGLVIVIVLVPVCAAMGAALPLMLRCLPSTHPGFGTLYGANLLGALTGCLWPLASIELYGFRATLLAAASLSSLAALLSWWQSARLPGDRPIAATHAGDAIVDARTALLLFLTGMAMLGSEIIWVRAFTPIVSTTVYAFAMILAVYLFFNVLGSWCHLRFSRARGEGIFLAAFPASLLLSALGGAYGWHTLWALLVIAPACFISGYLTPCLIDNAGLGRPAAAARAYAFNIAGCIAGPLAATYLLFPYIGLKGTVACFALLLLLALTPRARAGALLLLVLPALALWRIPDNEQVIAAHGRLYRDHVGYIGALDRGHGKELLVNGVGMTVLTTITKNMAHLPMAYRPQARSALVICFGMGTTTRSLSRWPLDSITVAELSPGVLNAFDYFYTDAAQLRADPRLHFVADDGRRFLSRADRHFDVITLDPPPPLSGAASGLLYTAQFIALAKSRLNPGGILAHWLPEGGDPLLTHAITRAISDHFRYVLAYRSVENWGLHFLASDEPLPPLTPQAFLAAMPPAAQADLKELYPSAALDNLAARSLRAVDPASLIQAKNHAVMSDDRLYNEFYAIRRGSLLPY